MYTHNFNLHLHYKTWEVPTPIIQYTQGLKTNAIVVLLPSHTEFTHLAKLPKFSISLNHTINGSNNNPIMYKPTPSVEPETMDIFASQAHPALTYKANILQAVLCFRFGNSK